MGASAVGFIGLGRMGFPMARNLAAAGHAVHVFDVERAALDRAAGVRGVVPHPSPAAVAAAVPVLFTALPNDDVVARTYLGDGGVLAAAPRGLVSCDCSTVTPGTSRAIAAAGRERGVVHMDTPMLGSSPQAESGEIFFIVAGEPAQVPVVQPFLDVMGRRSMHVGPSGTANQIKLLHNALGAVNAVAVAESLALCAQAGVDLRTYYEIVREGGGMAYSTYFDRRTLRIAAGEFSPTFTLDLMLKDVTLAAQMAGAALEHCPVLRETLETYRAASARGWGAEDFSAVTHVIEARLGRPIAPSPGVSAA
jgi:3-hydroxyisobutyrate dehydrogenase